MINLRDQEMDDALGTFLGARPFAEKLDLQDVEYARVLAERDHLLDERQHPELGLIGLRAQEEDNLTESARGGDDERPQSQEERGARVFELTRTKSI